MTIERRAFLGALPTTVAAVTAIDPVPAADALFPPDVVPPWLRALDELAAAPRWLNLPIVYLDDPGWRLKQQLAVALYGDVVIAARDVPPRRARRC